jgi:hypothetical protein
MMPDEVTIESVALPGRTGAFRVTLRDVSIGAIRPAEQTGDAAWLALPGFTNLHAHADRAYTVQSFRPRSLSDAVAAAAARVRCLPPPMWRRGPRGYSNGRSGTGSRGSGPTDVDPVVEMRSMEGVLAAKQRMGERLDVDHRVRPRRTIWRSRTRSTAPSGPSRWAPITVGAKPQCQRRSVARTRSLFDLAGASDCRSISTSTSISSRSTCSRAWSPTRSSRAACKAASR